MTSRRSSWIVAALLTLVVSTAHAQTSPSCAQIPNLACATAADTITGPWTLSGAAPEIYDGATAGTNATTLTITDPTAARTFTVPDANSVAIQPLTCSSTDKMSAVSALGVITCSADVGANHAILSATHTDSATNAVLRGAVIVGNSTPAWARLAVGGANTFLHSDGTDTTFAAIVAADIGAGDLANALVWQTVCTADPCVLSPVPRADGTLLVVHRGFVLRQVAAAPGINEIEFTTPNIDFNASQGVATGVDSAIVYYEL